VKNGGWRDVAVALNYSGKQYWNDCWCHFGAVCALRCPHKGMKSKPKQETRKKKYTNNSKSSGFKTSSGCFYKLKFEKINSTCRLFICLSFLVGFCLKFALLYFSVLIIFSNETHIRDGADSIC
jgi:hypothetical protein